MNMVEDTYFETADVICLTLGRVSTYQAFQNLKRVHSNLHPDLSMLQRVSVGTNQSEYIPVGMLVCAFSSDITCF